MPDPATEPDPPPLPPRAPAPEDCCHGGCARCVFDLHADALEHYAVQLRQWQARNEGRDPAGPGDTSS